MAPKDMRRIEWLSSDSQIRQHDKLFVSFFLRFLWPSLPIARVHLSRCTLRYFGYGKIAQASRAIVNGIVDQLASKVPDALSSSQER